MILVHDMKAHMAIAVRLHSFLTSVIDGMSDYLHAIAVLAQGKECLVPTKYVVRSSSKVS